MPDLLMEWEEAQEMPHGVPKILKKYSNYTLLILDEWLIQTPTEPQLHFLFELIERRYDENSTIFCTQYKFEEWHARMLRIVRLAPLMCFGLSVFGHGNR
jgi:DNA replication protein DnaC